MTTSFIVAKKRKKTTIFRKICYNNENMEALKKAKISIIVEDRNLQDYIVLILMGEDYDVKAYTTQSDALSNLEKDFPDVIVSIFHSSNINGLDICKVLRKNFLFRYTPIIFILEDTDSLNKAKLIYAGGDDYLQRSMLEEELLLKIKLSLSRVAREKDINPLTMLPGQSNLLKELQKRIDEKALFAICCADLYKLRFYNQRYGFKKGDEVIRYVSSSILKILREFGSPSDFLAHPQNDDFFFLTPHDSAEAVADKITKTFDLNISSFYDMEDRKRGHLLIKNRKGEILKIPFLRVYVGIVTNENYQFFNPTQVIQIVTELVEFAQKSSEKSAYAKERRKVYPFY